MRTPERIFKQMASVHRYKKPLCDVTGKGKVGGLPIIISGVSGEHLGVNSCLEQKSSKIMPQSGE